MIEKLFRRQMCPTFNKLCRFAYVVSIYKRHQILHCIHDMMLMDQVQFFTDDCNHLSSVNWSGGKLTIRISYGFTKTSWKFCFEIIFIPSDSNQVPMEIILMHNTVWTLLLLFVWPCTRFVFNAMIVVIITVVYCYEMSSRFTWTFFKKSN